MPLELARNPEPLVELALKLSGRDLTEEQIRAHVDEVAKYVEAQAKDGLRPYFGDAAVKIGVITVEERDKALNAQARQMMGAAVIDISTIARDGGQEGAPAANYGNYGVNDAQRTTLVDAASMVSNIAKNMVVAANGAPNPKESAQAMKPVLEKADKLFGQLTMRDQRLSPAEIEKLREEFISEARTAIEKTSFKATDKKGNEINLGDYFDKRGKDIQSAIESLGQGMSQLPPITGIKLANNTTVHLAPHAAAKDPLQLG